MSRLIDADALKAAMIETLEQIKANPKMDGQEMHIIAGIAMLGEMIDDSLTIDAVPVVRCRECKYACKSSVLPLVICGNGKGLVDPRTDTFCSYGERKEAEHETTDR